MQIKLAKTAGFCFGVNRAVDRLYQMVKSGESVCTLPIIHNPQVIDDLKSKGVVIANSIDEIPQNTNLVLRTHGVEKQVIDELKARGYEYWDAACPFVKKIHKIVTDNSDENSIVLIAGDANHPEVQGIKSYCKGEVIVFKNLDELEKSELNCKKRIIVVAQTTFNTVEWEKCLKKLKKRLYKCFNF